MTDGEPTLAWNDYRFSTGDAIGNSNNYNSGDGSHADMSLAMLTVLTASYFKRQVYNHYFNNATTGNAVSNNPGAGMFTIGLGDGVATNEVLATLNPFGVYSPGVTNAHRAFSKYPSTNLANNAIQNNPNFPYSMYALLNEFVAGSTRPIPLVNRWGGAAGFQPSANWVTLTNYGNLTLSDLRYTDLFISAQNSAQLADAFASITEHIISGANFITVIDGDADFDGYLTFSDPIGEFMEVRRIEYLTIDPDGLGGTPLRLYPVTSATAVSADQFADIFLSHQAYGDGFNLSRSEVIALYNSKQPGDDGFKYFANSHRQWVGNFYSPGGVEQAPPAGATAVVEFVMFEDRGIIDYVQGGTTNTRYIALHIITSIAPDGTQFRGIYSETLFGSGSGPTRVLNRGDQIVRWFIPASLIPMRTLDTSVGHDDANFPQWATQPNPIRVRYSVGLNVDRLESLLAGDLRPNTVPLDEVNDSAFRLYQEVNRESGTNNIHFYTNRHFKNNNGVRAVDMNNISIAYFEPVNADPIDSLGRWTVKTSNVTGTAPHVTRLQYSARVGANPGAYVNWLGNNGRITIPFIDIEVIKDWEGFADEEAIENFGIYIGLYTIPHDANYLTYRISRPISVMPLFGDGLESRNIPLLSALPADQDSAHYDETELDADYESNENPELEQENDAVPDHVYDESDEGVVGGNDGEQEETVEIEYPANIDIDNEVVEADEGYNADEQQVAHASTLSYYVEEYDSNDLDYELTLPLTGSYDLSDADEDILSELGLNLDTGGANNRNNAGTESSDDEDTDAERSGEENTNAGSAVAVEQLEAIVTYDEEDFDALGIMAASADFDTVYTITVRWLGLLAFELTPDSNGDSVSIPYSVIEGTGSTITGFLPMSLDEPATWVDFIPFQRPPIFNDGVWHFYLVNVATLHPNVNPAYPQSSLRIRKEILGVDQAVLDEDPPPFVIEIEGPWTNQPPPMSSQYFSYDGPNPRQAWPWPASQSTFASPRTDLFPPGEEEILGYGSYTLTERGQDDADWENRQGYNFVDASVHLLVAGQRPTDDIYVLSDNAFGFDIGSGGRHVMIMVTNAYERVQPEPVEISLTINKEWSWGREMSDAQRNALMDSLRINVTANWIDGEGVLTREVRQLSVSQIPAYFDQDTIAPGEVLVNEIIANPPTGFTHSATVEASSAPVAEPSNRNVIIPSTQPPITFEIRYDNMYTVELMNSYTAVPNPPDPPDPPGPPEPPPPPTPPPHHPHHPHQPSPPTGDDRTVIPYIIMIGAGMLFISTPATLTYRHRRIKAK